MNYRHDRNKLKKIKRKYSWVVFFTFLLLHFYTKLVMMICVDEEE